MIICLYICLFIYSFIYLFIHLFVCLFIYLFIEIHNDYLYINYTGHLVFTRTVGIQTLK